MRLNFVAGAVGKDPGAVFRGEGVTIIPVGELAMEGRSPSGARLCGEYETRTWLYQQSSPAFADIAEELSEPPKYEGPSSNPYLRSYGDRLHKI